MDYSGLPEQFPEGEYRLDATSYSFIRNVKHDLIFVRALGVIKNKKAEQWKK